MVVGERGDALAGGRGTAAVALAVGRSTAGPMSTAALALNGGMSTAALAGGRITISGTASCVCARHLQGLPGRLRGLCKPSAPEVPGRGTW